MTDQESAPRADYAFPAEGYERLFDVLRRAHNRSAYGKGLKRHVRADEPFHDQPIISICRSVGPGFALGQAVKKITENHESPEARVLELLDAIVYLAAGVIVLEDHHAKLP